MLRKWTITFSEGLSILGFDNKHSNSAQESSPNKESNDSNNNFSANEPSTSKKMAQHVVSRVYSSRRGVKQDHVIGRKISTQQTQK